MPSYAILDPRERCHVLFVGLLEALVLRLVLADVLYDGDDERLEDGDELRQLGVVQLLVHLAYLLLAETAKEPRETIRTSIESVPNVQISLLEGNTTFFQIPESYGNQHDTRNPGFRLWSGYGPVSTLQRCPWCGDMVIMVRLSFSSAGARSAPDQSSHGGSLRLQSTAAGILLTTFC